MVFGMIDSKNCAQAVQEVKCMDRMIKRLTKNKWTLPLILVVVLYLKSLFLLVTLYEASPRIFLMSLLSFAPISVIVSFSFLFEGRKKLIYLFVVNAFYSITFYADMTYFDGLNRLFSLYVLYLKNISPEFAASTGEYFMNLNFLVFTDLPFALYFVVKSKGIVKRETEAVKRNREATLKKISLFGTAFAMSFIVMLTQFFTVAKTAGIENYENHALMLSPVGNHMINMAAYVRDSVKKLNEEEVSEVDAWFNKNSTHFSIDQQYEDLKGILAGKNLIVVHFESLESFVLDYEFEGQEITPNINKLMENSISFPNVYEQIQEGVSSDSELMFNTGLYPAQKGSAFMSYGENTYFALPKLLQRSGYHTMAVHGDKDTFWNRDIVYPNIGIDDYIHEDLFEDKRYSGLGILDESLFKQSVKEIERTSKPYYSYVMTVTSHTPFTIEEEHRYLGVPGEDNDAGYLESIHYTDYHLGKFYEELEEKGELENTAIIVFGDHEGIHKYHESALPENNKKVPFFIHIPGMEGMEVDTIGGQVDMLPTILYMLGAEEETYSDKVMGSNLLREGVGSVILSTGEVIGVPHDMDHLTEAPYISNLILTGDYFAVSETDIDLDDIIEVVHSGERKKDTYLD